MSDTQGAALAAGIEDEKRAFDKAKQEVRPVTRAPKRLTARLLNSVGKEHDL